MRKIASKDLSRVLDANYNRTKEALRVCEDVVRFVLNDRFLTQGFKALRHQVSTQAKVIGYQGLLASRDIESDVGTGTKKTELKRHDVADIFYANIQRAKESVRVLEEFAKLTHGRAAVQLKKIRYQLYALEKKASLKV